MIEVREHENQRSSERKKRKKKKKLLVLLFVLFRKEEKKRKTFGQVNVHCGGGGFLRVCIQITPRNVPLSSSPDPFLGHQGPFC